MWRGVASWLALAVAGSAFTLGCAGPETAGGAGNGAAGLADGDTGGAGSEGSGAATDPDDGSSGPSQVEPSLHFETPLDGATVTYGQRLILAGRLSMVRTPDDVSGSDGSDEIGGAGEADQGTEPGGVADNPWATWRGTWHSDLDGSLGVPLQPSPDGHVQTIVPRLQAGWHTITLQASRQEPPAQLSVSHRLGVCIPVIGGDNHGFDLDLRDNPDWRVFGDATWDPGGWLEMTGNQPSRKGAIFNVGRRVQAGDVAMRFRIWTGGGTGADGFALSVIAADTVEDLERALRFANAGGGLGYAYTEGYTGTAYEPPEGFHVEIDTWANPFDPTRDNHVAVTLDGNPQQHHLWVEVPSIEDQAWHEVTVIVEGSQVVVTLDNYVVIDGIIDSLRFKGGFVGFSGTTGAATNYHRFDDLQILDNGDHAGTGCSVDPLVASEATRWAPERAAH